jgi:hypothetical protein
VNKAQILSLNRVDSCFEIIQFICRIGIIDYASALASSDSIEFGLSYQLIGGLIVDFFFASVHHVLYLFSHNVSTFHFSLKHGKSLLDTSHIHILVSLTHHV